MKQEALEQVDAILAGYQRLTPENRMTVLLTIEDMLKRQRRKSS